MISPRASPTNDMISPRPSPANAMMSPRTSPTSAMISHRTSSASAMISPRTSLASALMTQRKLLRENSNVQQRSVLSRKPAVAAGKAARKNKSQVTEVERPAEKKPQPVIEPDEYFGLEKILKLDFHNYDEYLQGLQKALVMFYEPGSQDSIHPGKQFTLTAFQTTDREHGFASVDCSKESELCYKEKISSLPQFKLFTLGFLRGSIQDPAQFDAKALKSLLQASPEQHKLSTSLKSPTLPAPPPKPESPIPRRKQVV